MKTTATDQDPSTRRVSLLDLRRQWYAVLGWIERGQAVLITRSGVPIAQIRPYNPPDLDEQSSLEAAELTCLDPEIRDLSEGMANLLGTEQLAALLGVGPALLRKALISGVYTADVLLRFDAVVDLVAMLRQHLTTEELLAWLHRPRRQFRSRSPAMVLQAHWTPGDSTHQQVVALLTAEVMRPGKR